MSRINTAMQYDTSNAAEPVLFLINGSGAGVSLLIALMMLGAYVFARG
jgi:hypothetical protein